MGIVFVLAVAGLAAWNYSLGVKNDLLAQKTEEQELQLKDTKTNWIHWGPKEHL